MSDHSMSLFTRLNISLENCPIVGQRFLPCNILDEAITKESIRRELPLRTRLIPDGFLSRLTHDAKKLFAILVLIDESHAIKKFLRDGITDQDLPLSTVGDINNSSVLETARGTRINSLAGWKSKARVISFLEKQWLVLAPVLDLNGGFISIHQQYPLPFLQGDEVGGSHHSTVYKSVLHAAHRQDIRQNGSTDLLIAVKVFKRADHFTKERKNLEQLRGLDDSHLIKHLLSFERGLSYYIIFPWADGGSLKEFWARHSPNPKIMLWSLQQMLGITHALRTLHDAKCRHGDLKPENILHFTQGGQGILVVADVGVSRIHTQVTQLRGGPTTTKATTPSYEPPEVFIHENKPRARRYDIWSTACIFLEFVVWMLHGFEAIQNFANSRDNPEHSFFKLDVSSGIRTADIHPSVLEAVDAVREDPRCKGDTSLSALLDLITKHLLQINVDDRVTADVLHNKLHRIVQRAAQTPSYLLRRVENTTEAPPIFQRNAMSPSDLQTSTSAG